MRFKNNLYEWCISPKTINRPITLAELVLIEIEIKKHYI